MRHATLSLLALAGGLLVTSMGACGGRVIVDGKAGEGGAGGMPSTTFSGPACSFPAPIGATLNCSASAASGPGGPATCTVATCDGANNQFVASCTGESCTCSYSPAKGGESFGCNCLRKGSCGDGGRDCCPFHF